MAQMPEAIILRKTEETKTGVTYCMADVKTNADRIRAMTDEELARFMTPDNFKFPCPPNKAVIGLCEYDKIPCWICWVRWLKSPVEETK